MAEIEIKANDAAGVAFLVGMSQCDAKWREYRKLFTKFIEENGFNAWHIHDGWVTYNFRSGEDVLYHYIINLVWINQHVGYSHTTKCPEIGEKIVIIKDSPGTGCKGAFSMYCYEVIEDEYKESSTFSTRLKLGLIEIREVIFNEELGSYEFYIRPIYTKPLSFISKLLKKLL